MLILAELGREGMERQMSTLLRGGHSTKCRYERLLHLDLLSMTLLVVQLGTVKNGRDSNGEVERSELLHGDMQKENPCLGILASPPSLLPGSTDRIPRSFLAVAERS